MILVCVRRQNVGRKRKEKKNEVLRICFFFGFDFITAQQMKIFDDHLNDEEWSTWKRLAEEIVK